jgi:two-component system phosphate regulon response regulator PhoB
MTATDAEEALLIARSSWQPDIVVLDPTLPGLDVSSAYEQVQTRNRAALIFVLGDGSEADEVRTLETGADDYVGKGVSPEVLLWPGCGRTGVVARPPAMGESCNPEISGWIRRITRSG